MTKADSPLKSIFPVLDTSLHVRKEKLGGRWGFEDELEVRE
jgi:hypothetical protein